MELQCKERVDLLEALRRSRKEAEKSKKDGEKSSISSTKQSKLAISPKAANSSPVTAVLGNFGDGTISSVSHPDISRAPPPLPHRPALPQQISDISIDNANSNSQPHDPATSPMLYATPNLPVPPGKTSRTPSPDKKGGRMMLTTLRGPKDAKGKPARSPRPLSARVSTPASSKAAGLAWDSTSKPNKSSHNPIGVNNGSGIVEAPYRGSSGSNVSSPPEFVKISSGGEQALGGNALVQSRSKSSTDLLAGQEPLSPSDFEAAQRVSSKSLVNGNSDTYPPGKSDLIDLNPPVEVTSNKTRGKSPTRKKPPIDYPSYRVEFPPTAPSSRATAEFNARITHRDEEPKTSTLSTRAKSPQKEANPSLSSGLSRQPVANSSSPRITRYDRENGKSASSGSNDENTSSGADGIGKKRKPPRQDRTKRIPLDPALVSSPNQERSPSGSESTYTWDERIRYIQKHLPKGVDEAAAKQIFNEIVVKGDEVHWDDVAGLEAAKTALKEAVVYPFLRPDLFMGLREPARGMLLFGPPGTGKTMLARAVATESRSTFFAISASSLTSKWLGESEKLVRALFSLAKALAPSIIFVDEIDSLLSSRGGSNEHESTRRIKTEFLIQWSDLQRAAAGKQQSDREKAEGDASRVLVLAATNMPWAIDEAARRRFVRRQYIPLPEAPVRAEQLKTLLGHQKHNLNKKDILVLVELTDGMHYSNPTNECASFQYL